VVDKQDSIQEETIQPSDEDISHVQGALADHFFRTSTGTVTDSRHDSAFGLAFYALQLLRESVRTQQDAQISARLVLRSLTECLINLAYLKKKDDPELWSTYRSYGCGQAKLSFLKLKDNAVIPTHIDIDRLEQLANEDLWQEFLPINVGHWAGLDLRKMSIEAGYKGYYDKYYDWSSSYSHGQWGAVRESCFDQCWNPLHKLHRIPSPACPQLLSILGDATTVCDAVLEILTSIYPGFDLRLCGN
jgi:hypothetical protein